MESFGLTRVLTCVSSLGSGTVQVPENTATHREFAFRPAAFFLFFLISKGIDANNRVTKQQPEEALLNLIEETRLPGKEESLKPATRGRRGEALREL